MHFHTHFFSVETMDQSKKKTNQILSPFNQIYSSKKAIKLLLSISLLCILFSYSSLLSTFYMNLFNYYYSSDRNYIFLLCNGILILIIKNSGLFAISPANSNHFTNKKNIDSHQYTGYNRDHIDNVYKNSQRNGYSASAVEVDKTECMVITYADEVVDNVELVAHNEEKEEEEEVDELLKFVENEEKVNEVCNVVVEEEEFGNVDEVEEGEGIELLSTEELNKKFDDFIRKMKQGIKFEAHHHHHNLVMV